MGLLLVVAVGCVKPKTVVFTRTPSPDSRLEAVVAWVENNAGATGGSGTTKVFVVPKGKQVDPTGSAVAEFYTNSDHTDINTIWVSPHELQIKTQDYELMKSENQVTVDSTTVQIQVVVEKSPIGPSKK